MLALRDIQLCLLDILKDVDVFCKAEDIRYSIAYGTLLGAVRHKGFIPWDDDIDLLMPRPDFERFVSAYGRHNDDRYRCFYHRPGAVGDPFVHFFAKVADMETRAVNKGRMTEGLGVTLDIFPVDGKPDNPAEHARFERRLTHYSHRLNICETRLDLLNFHQPLFSKLEAHIMGPDHWCRRMHAMMSEYPYTDCRFAGAVSVMRNGTREIFEKIMFEEYVSLEFENCRFPAVSRWDLFLRQQFGDYMTPPPVGKRQDHCLSVCRMD